MAWVCAVDVSDREVVGVEGERVDAMLITLIFGGPDLKDADGKLQTGDADVQLRGDSAKISASRLAHASIRGWGGPVRRSSHMLAPRL